MSKTHDAPIDGSTEYMRYAVAFNLSRALAQLLQLLNENDIVTHDMIETTCNVESEPKVLVWRLRNALKTARVQVRSHQNMGYSLDAKSRSVVRAMVNAGVDA